MKQADNKIIHKSYKAEENKMCLWNIVPPPHSRRDHVVKVNGDVIRHCLAQRISPYPSLQILVYSHHTVYNLRSKVTDKFVDKQTERDTRADK